MGVPAFFRWLSRKYAAIVVHCVEEKKKELNGVTIPVDSSQPNPNDIEFDNLYLDMNGIIHPCTHPEDKPAPKNEAEMMVAIFEYIDRIFSVVRPRKLLYMAIDGVAPRAKMNQQRSRRFRAAQETQEKFDDMQRIKEEILSRGGRLPPERTDIEKFDSNCITPGTPFMFRLADCLRYYVHERLNNDPGWAGIKVVLSDANVPGEGEHKIMDYIRKQRSQPDHDPNTQHCLCGADADLIMLGLATHEPNFTIIREEFKPNKPKPCDICAQFGHEAKECQGLPKKKDGENDELPPEFGQEVEFIFLRLCVLREYLERELHMDNVPFTYDFERALDDWVFMCFFVGNDFLPHLPSLQIRENAIDRLIRIYKKTVHKCGGYLTDSGVTNLSRVQYVLQELGEVEDEIFKKRRDDDVSFRRRNKEKRRRMRAQSERGSRPSFTPGGQYAPQAPGAGSGPVSNPRVTAYQGRMQAPGAGSGPVSNPRVTAYQGRMQALAGYNKSDGANQEAAQQLKAMMTRDSANGNDRRGAKRKGGPDEDSDSDPEPEDNVKLWEDGWKDRYYQNKFGTGESDEAFRHKVANEYVIGLCWVLRYYYQGCPSWKWYFPFHYAPFASDFVNIGDLPNDFERNTEPFKPLEQLMGVFPAASKQHLPEPWQPLMCEPSSPIIDFYPIDFKVDLNGKKYAWQGVVLLPFVDEKRLKAALVDVYPLLTEAEKKRNTRGADRLFVGQKHPLFALFQGVYENSINEPTDLDTKLSQGMGGLVWTDDMATMTGRLFKSPLPQCESIPDNQAIGVSYHDPKYDNGHIYPAKTLPGAKFPDRVLKPEDFRKQDSFRPQLGFQRDSGYRGRGHYNPAVAQRTVRHSLPGRYSNVGPPQSQQQHSNRYQPYQRQNTGSSSYGQMYGGQMGNYRPQWPQQQQQMPFSSYGGGGGGGGYGGGNYATGQYSYQSGRQDDNRGYGGGGGGGRPDHRRDDRRQHGRSNTYPYPSNYRR